MDSTCDYINIISKEPITGLPNWFITIVLIICISTVIIAYIYACRSKSNSERRYAVLLISMAAALVFELCALTIGTIAVKEPTGRFKYSATIDKDKISVTQYEQFIKKYKPDIIDDIYYWED